MSSTLATPFSSGAEEQGYIEQQAAAAGLDAKALLAVAAHEGGTLPAHVGDNGTSFGPWQLHAGGALPAEVWAKGPQYADAWANSPAGIDYAISGIAAKVGGAKSGLQEIAAQVLNFERPANPMPEIAAADATYVQGGGPSLAEGAASAGLGQTGTQQTGGLYSPAGSQTGAQDVSLTTTLFGGVKNDAVRILEIIVGAGLVALAVGGVMAALLKSKTSPMVLVDAVKDLNTSTPRQRADASHAAREQRAGETHQRRQEVARARVRQERAKARREELTVPKRTRKPAASERTQAVRARAARAQQSEEIPF